MEGSGIKLPAGITLPDGFEAGEPLTRQLSPFWKYAAGSSISFRCEREVTIKEKSRWEVVDLNTGEVVVLPDWTFLRNKLAAAGAAKGKCYLLAVKGKEKMAKGNAEGKFKNKEAWVGDVWPLGQKAA